MNLFRSKEDIQNWTEFKPGTEDGIVSLETAARILSTPRGDGGFGYDPLFFAPELGATFAELGVGTKNGLSHRARAMAAMKPHIVNYFRLAKPGTSG